MGTQTEVDTTARMIEVALAQVEEAMKVADHLATIIPKVAAMEAENRRLRRIERLAWQYVPIEEMRAALEATDERP